MHPGFAQLFSSLSCLHHPIVTACTFVSGVYIAKEGLEFWTNPLSLPSINLLQRGQAAMCNEILLQVLNRNPCRCNSKLLHVASGESRHFEVVAVYR